MKSIDLNSDMGEGLGPWSIGDGVDAQIMPLISSANIATGFHAGDPGTMRVTVECARRHGVAVGAHPGFRDLVGFGRRHMRTSAQELTDDILYQLGALREFARLEGVNLQHVKPHGALYMHLAKDAEAAERFVATLNRLDPELYLYCMHGSALWRAAVDAGQPVICEFYGDRDYDRSGSIVFTRTVGALDPDQVADKVLHACETGRVRTVEGDEIPVVFESVCIHSDTPGALALVQATRKRLEQADIRVRSPR